MDRRWIVYAGDRILAARFTNVEAPWLRTALRAGDYLLRFEPSERSLASASTNTLGEYWIHPPVG